MERRVTCSISPGTYSQKLVWYLANIFSNGRSLNHHWTFGIRCLKKPPGIIHILLIPINNDNNRHMSFDKTCEFAYSKSVTSLSSVTGLNAMTFLLRPSTHAVSGELANTRSGGKRTVSSKHCCRFLSDLSTTALCNHSLPCLKFSVSLSEIHWIALTPNLVPKFLSKGEGAPP